MYPFHLIISREVPDFDPSTAEYDKDQIKSFFSGVGYNKKFLESIDNDFCDVFHKARAAIFKKLERKFNTLEESERRRKTSEWISVKDMLPKPKKTVLCLWKDTKGIHYGFATYQHDDIWYVENQGIPEVTHWMDLPSKKGLNDN